MRSLGRQRCRSLPCSLQFCETPYPYSHLYLHSISVLYPSTMHMLVSFSSSPCLLRASFNFGANSFLTVTSVAFSCWKHMAALAGGVLFWSRICQTVSQSQQRKFYELSPALEKSTKTQQDGSVAKKTVATKPEDLSSVPRNHVVTPQNYPLIPHTLPSRWTHGTKFYKKRKNKRINSVTSRVLWEFSLFCIPISTCTKPDWSTFLSLLRQGVIKTILFIFLKYGKHFRDLKYEYEHYFI